MRVPAFSGHSKAPAKLASRPRRVVVSVAATSIAGKNVVIIGGTGRVGSSTASALIKSFPDLNVTIASRSTDSHKAAVERRPDLKAAGFKAVDINNKESIKVGLHHRSTDRAGANTANSRPS